MVKKRIIEKFIEKNQEIRDFLFRPLLVLLTKYNVSPAFLSNLKLIVFLPFIFLAFKNLKIAFLFFLLSFLIDILDGPLARYQKVFSDRGKFIDTFGDFTIYLITLLMLFYLDLVNKDILIYYFFIFPITTILLIIKKHEFTKTDWIIKPAPEIGYLNAIVFFFMFLLVYFNINYMGLVLLLTSLFYTLLSIYCFIYIQFRWLNFNKR